ncbi:MAG: transglycosylase domain-containing protein [Acidimicrobiia bacterium]
MRRNPPIGMSPMTVRQPSGTQPSRSAGARRPSAAPNGSGNGTRPGGTRSGGAGSPPPRARTATGNRRPAPPRPGRNGNRDARSAAPPQARRRASENGNGNGAVLPPRTARTARPPGAPPGPPRRPAGPSRPSGRGPARVPAQPRAPKKPGLFWRYRRVLFLLGFLLFTAVTGAVWVIARIPLPSEAPLARTTLIFDASGKQVAELHGVENRFPVPLADVPAITQAAVIAAEDRKFLEHKGVDPWGILRATWVDIRNEGGTQGGSTITQQYVKNQIVGSDRTLARKLKEAVVAIKLERKYSKQEILEKYLNTVYFGRGAYGIEAASQTYFKHPASELDLKESAYLAGLIRIPSNGDVFVDPESAYFVRSSVLTNMVRSAVITQADADAVEATKIEHYVFAPEIADTSFTNPSNGVEYFVEFVRQELFRKYGEDRVLRGGLRVHTSLDPKTQAIAYDTIYGNDGYLPPSGAERDPIAALVSVDGEGRVVAMVGNRDWAKSQVNVAVGELGGGSGRQGGSAFKPFVLAEAVNRGISVTDKYYPGPAEIGPLPGWEEPVHNYNEAGYGFINLTEATVNSVNTVYAQLVGEVGADKVVQMAKSLGITSELNPVPSITLGTQEVSVMEMANAYLTFFNDGMHVDARVITRVTDGDAVIVPDEPSGRRRAIPRETAEKVREVLGAVVERGSGTAARLPNSDVWGKTGTTEGFGDAWFVGGNEKLVTAVWMGYEEGQARQLLNVRGIRQVSGGTLPAAIFRDFVNEAAPGDGKAANVAPLDASSLNSPSPGVVTTVPRAPVTAAVVEEAPVPSTTTAPAVQPTTTVASPPATSSNTPATNPAPSSPLTTAPPRTTSSLAFDFPEINRPGRD